jgi:hypothetical protein
MLDAEEKQNLPRKMSDVEEHLKTTEEDLKTTEEDLKNA